MPVRDAVSVGRVADSALHEDLVDEATALIDELVGAGAAIGWVDPPGRAEVAALLASVAAAGDGDAGLLVARHGGELAGLGYWRRYARPTIARHADLELLAVRQGWQGAGVGRVLARELIASARDAGVEMLTLDFRGDNLRAQALYESLGFRRYGVLGDFVVTGGRRYDRLMYVLDLR